MCCFSQPVELVADTNIFARSANGRQYLVYSMTYAAGANLAMVLPLPVLANPAEDAIRFINLKRYPDFFKHMRHGFPQPLTKGVTTWAAGVPAARAPKLRVHEVGSFEASFVPRIEDFDRLDERFRIPRGVWDQLPAYHDYGFAVFKLKGSHAWQAARGLRRLFGGGSSEGPAKPRQVHPMALEFPRRNPDLLYFPTVHVHDRKLHPHAMFDHMLYCQPDPGMDDYLQDWERSVAAASTFMDIKRAAGILAPNHYCWRRPLVGRLENKDTLVGKAGSVPKFATV